MLWIELIVLVFNSKSALMILEYSAWIQSCWQRICVLHCQCCTPTITWAITSIGWQGNHYDRVGVKLDRTLMLHKPSPKRDGPRCTNTIPISHHRNHEVLVPISLTLKATLVNDRVRNVILWTRCFMRVIQNWNALTPSCKNPIRLLDHNESCRWSLNRRICAFDSLEIWFDSFASCAILIFFAIIGITIGTIWNSIATDDLSCSTPLGTIWRACIWCLHKPHPSQPSKSSWFAVVVKASRVLT